MTTAAEDICLTYHDKVFAYIRGKVENHHDAVVLLTTGISFEFIQRNHLGECCGFMIVVLEIPHCRHAGNIEPAADFLGGYNFLKGKDNLCYKKAGNSVVVRQESVPLPN